MKSRMIRSFSATHHPLIIPVFMVVVYLINSILPNPIPSIYMAILLMVFVIWVFASWWDNQTAILIKQYCILTKHLELIKRDATTEFDKLHVELYKWNSKNPFRMLYVDIDLIETEFIQLLRKINTSNGDFKAMIECENILSYRDDWSSVVKKYEDLISELNKPDFSEIKDTVQKDLLVSSLLLKNKWGLIDRHNSELEIMIQEWQSYLPEIPLTETTEYPNKLNKNEFDISFIERIETLQFFKDEDIFYHCQSLKLLWNNLKKNSIDYMKNKKALHDLIKENINQKLKTQNVSLYSDSDGLYVSIFKELIMKTKNKNSGYDYFFDDYISGGVLIHRVSYCNKLKIPGGRTQKDDRTCHNIDTTNEHNKIKEMHKELIKEITTQYIGQSKKLIELEDKLRKDMNLLNEALNTVRLNPISRMDCDIIKKGENVDGNT